MRYLLTGLILALSLPALGATQTRTSSFSYDPNTGLLIQEVIEPDNAALRLQTDYVYDNFGNKVSVTVSGIDIATRTSTTTYDANGQFPVSSANALGHTETRVYDARFGTVVSLTGPNALTTTWSYDGFGRKVLETRADTTSTTVAYNASDANCASVAYAYSVTTTTSGAPSSGTCYDMLNREIRSYAQGFDSTIVYKDTQYDSLGRVSQVSRPYYAGGTPKWTTYAYDSIGRVYQATEPNNSVTSTTYNGLTTTLTDANNHTTTRVKNSQGQLIQVTDAKGGITSYSYDPFGNLTQTTDAKNNLTTLAYDLRGRKTGMVDPDMGSWSYQYNVLGELVWQKDAKNQVTTLTYDKLGRMLTRGEPDLTSTWTYDTATKGIGKPSTVSAGNGFYRSFAYDSLGRNYQNLSIIDVAYTVTTTFDAYGRVATYAYPTANGSRFTLKNVYNAQGYLAEVRNNATNALYWQATAKDAEGHLLNQTLGNTLTTSQAFDPNTGRLQSILTGAVQNVSYSFDNVGNLLARSDSVQSLVEGFTFDELNRLQTYSNNGANTQSYQYDSIGNITYKSDQGLYTYGSKPHAVTQVVGAAVTNTYAYDSNGNLTSGAGRTVTWNSFNMVAQITQGSATLSFNYDADHTRIKEVSPTATTIYLNPRLDSGQHFEKVINTSGVTEYKQYIYAGGIPVGVYTSRSNGVNDTKYFHTDHLGSIAVVTNESGAVIARYSYDPFGNRTTVAGDPNATEHGFTGHETLVEVGLVNMNGRVYDPGLARFMSADPNIQAPGNGQSFNRYSYVLNNPLSLTDPSGFSWWTKLRTAIFHPAQLILSHVSYSTGQTLVNIGSAFCGPYAPMCAAAGTYDNGMAHGMSSGDAFRSGAKAGAMAYFSQEANGYIGDNYPTYGSNVAAHAVLGCAESSMGGGSCGSGAMAGGFSAAAAPYIASINSENVGRDFGRTMAAAVVGGTASVMGGGKFENGAMTGAFAQMYNADGDHPSDKQPGYRLKRGVPLPSTQIDELLSCTADCAGENLRVTSTSDSHGQNDPHTRGLAVDLTTSNPEKVMQCAANCGAVYQQNEYQHPSSGATGGHVHLQLVPGRKGKTGPYYPED